MTRLATLAALGLAAGLVLLACQAEQPASFEGPRIGKPNNDKGDDDDDKDGNPKDDTSTTQASTTDDDPPVSPATPPKEAGAPTVAVPDCKASATMQACMTCCDTGAVYQTFFNKFIACAQDAACKSAASQECLANATCKAADNCMAVNSCWTKADANDP